MTIKDRIKQILTDNPIILFMKGTPQFPQCGFSAQATNAISQTIQACGEQYRGNEFTTINILEDPELRQGLKDYSNWPTFPQLYVNGELIGGSDIIVDMFEAGELQNALQAGLLIVTN